MQISGYLSVTIGILGIAFALARIFSHRERSGIVILVISLGLFWLGLTWIYYPPFKI